LITNQQTETGRTFKFTKAFKTETGRTFKFTKAFNFIFIFFVIIINFVFRFNRNIFLPENNVKRSVLLKL